MEEAFNTYISTIVIDLNKLNSVNEKIGKLLQIRINIINTNESLYTCMKNINKDSLKNEITKQELSILEEKTKMMLYINDANKINEINKKLALIKTKITEIENLIKLITEKENKVKKTIELNKKIIHYVENYIITNF